jgi:hypothetical protein
MRLGMSVMCLVVCLAWAAVAPAQTKTYTWSDIDCRQSRIAAWPGMKCRATNVATMEGNIGVFRQWAAIGTTREGYYVHMFVWEAQNTFSYLSAEETTADFAKWMFEHGKTAAQFSPVARYQDSDYVTFKDDKHGRTCVGFRRMGKFHRGGYDSITGGIMCAPSGKTLTTGDIAIFIDNVRLQQVSG